MRGGTLPLLRAKIVTSFDGSSDAQYHHLDERSQKVTSANGEICDMTGPHSRSTELFPLQHCALSR